MPDDMEVLTYPDVVVYPSRVQKSEPFASHKLPVGHKVSDTAITGKLNKLVGSITNCMGNQI